jgi:hypothetical protein
VSCSSPSDLSSVAALSHHRPGCFYMAARASVALLDRRQVVASADVHVPMPVEDVVLGLDLARARGGSGSGSG